MKKRLFGVIIATLGLALLPPLSHAALISFQGSSVFDGNTGTLAQGAVNLDLEFDPSTFEFLSGTVVSIVDLPFFQIDVSGAPTGNDTYVDPSGGLLFNYSSATSLMTVSGTFSGTAADPANDFTYTGTLLSAATTLFYSVDASGLTLGSITGSGLDTKDSAFTNIFGLTGTDWSFSLNFPLSFFDFGDDPDDLDEFLPVIAAVGPDFATDFGTLDNLGGNPVQGVPEPGTMLLLGSGLIGLAGYGRRRRSSRK